MSVAFDLGLREELNPNTEVCRHCGRPVRAAGGGDSPRRERRRRRVERAGGHSALSSAAAANPVFPPLETPPGAPGIGYLIAYEDLGSDEGWAAGLVKAIEDGWQERLFTVETRNGELCVSRGAVFYWWPPIRHQRANPSRAGNLAGRI